ncbi:MAG: glycine cleavage system protein GcvH [Caldisericia bacterium]|nr:glycine cleavage system protein GcvH [Caldisericia bacterium]
MKKAILSCNGSDKPVGKIARNLALKLSQLESSEIICPVLCSQYPNRYHKEDYEEVVVIDGCPAKCATKIATNQLVITKRFLISELLKENKLQHPISIQPEEADFSIVESLLPFLEKTENLKKGEFETDWASMPLTYQILKQDKYQFRIPEQQEIYFTENDTWCFINKNIARIGVTDYVQQSLSDILFFNTPEIGKKISQFDEVGSIESAKAVFEVISPVSGTVVRYNGDLVDHPEWINENPYEKGWIAEIQLTDFEEDRMLLINSEEYYQFLQKKVMQHE